MYRTPNDLRHDDADVREGVRDAIRFSVGVAVAAVVFLVVAAVWVSTCGGSTADTVTCGSPQRTLLGLGAPIILLLGGLRAFVRTYQAWRQDGVVAMARGGLVSADRHAVGAQNEPARHRGTLTSDVRFAHIAFGRSTVEISP